MKKLIKLIIYLPLIGMNYIAIIYINILKKFSIQIVHYWLDEQVRLSQVRKEGVIHRSKNETIRLSIFTPNQLCRFRVKTFSSKEPETLKWIDQSPEDGILYDVGANIGLYSIYYAACGKGKVYAFEPSVFNLPLLAKNIFENNQQDNIRIITNPLTRQNRFDDFTISTLEEGGALSAFGVDYGYDGEKIKKLLSYKTLGVSLDFLLKNEIITEFPTMIKIDVDGIEHLILEGAVEILKHPTCKTVLIEINDNFHEQSESCYKILSNSGFRLKEKRHSEMFDVGDYAKTFNQIWSKG